MALFLSKFGLLANYKFRNFRLFQHLDGPNLVFRNFKNVSGFLFTFWAIIINSGICDFEIKIKDFPPIKGLSPQFCPDDSIINLGIWLVEICRPFFRPPSHHITHPLLFPIDVVLCILPKFSAAKLRIHYNNFPPTVYDDEKNAKFGI